LQNKRREGKSTLHMNYQGGTRGRNEQRKGVDNQEKAKGSEQIK